MFKERRRSLFCGLTESCVNGMGVSECERATSAANTDRQNGRTLSEAVGARSFTNELQLIAYECLFSEMLYDLELL